MSKPIMLRKTSYFRVMALPACIAWGVLELIALQRSRLLARRSHQP
jgi:hypothetical protein